MYRNVRLTSREKYRDGLSIGRVFISMEKQMDQLPTAIKQTTSILTGLKLQSFILVINLQVLMGSAGAT